MLRRWLYVIPVVGGILAYVVLQSVTGTGGESGPRGTPPAIVGEGPDGKATPGPEDMGGFSLSEPIPTTIVWDIGDKPFVIPEGSTLVLVGEGVPIVDESTGKQISEVPVHASYWLIRNGKAEAKIDAETGELFDAVVDPADPSALADLAGDSD